MAESLRDQLSAALDEVEAETPAVPAEPVAPAGSGEDTTPPAASADGTSPPAADKPGRTAGRARDESGRLLPGPAKKEEPVQQQGKATGQPDSPATRPAAAEVKRPQRPSSWKKDYWEHWDKLDPKLAEYINQREGEYAKGVSTYKTEWERAKPLLDAVAPHQQLFQQHGIDPAQQIGKYIEIHKGLALGSPEQKLGMLLRIAQDYQIPVQNLFVRGQDGQAYFNPQVQAYQPQAQQQAAQQDPRAIYREIIAEERAVSEVQQMERDTEKYPHLATVKETMKGLLLSGLAEDLPAAYEAALRHPKHSDIFDAIQEQKRVSSEAERRAAEAKRVAAAKAAAVSPRTATPSANPGGGKKGLRSSYEEALSDAEGRV